MMYVAKISVETVGHGKSIADAKQACLQKVSEEIEIMAELAEGVTIPISMVDRVPLEIPSGYQLVVFERISHSSKNAYDWRFCGIKPNKYMIQEGSDGKTPVKISTLDRNSEIDFPLPCGSMEYCDGNWIPRNSLRYNR